MPITHSPGNLPKITLNGRELYTRSGTPAHRPVNKTAEAARAVTGATRRYGFTRSRQWKYTIACRSQDDITHIKNLVNDQTESSYNVTFNDGITPSSYNVVVSDVGEMTPVVDNIDYQDVKITLTEWV
jgi:hypothetical protein